MSSPFAREVKRELAAVLPEAAHCRRAQLAGVVFGAGSFAIASGGRYAVRVSLATPAVARHVVALVRLLGVEATVRTATSPPSGRRYEVVLGEDERGLQLLNEIGVLSDSFTVQLSVPRRVVERRCCAVAFLRGLFVGCGSVSAPGVPVHVEFTLAGADLGAQAQHLLARLGLPFALLERARNVACYSKRGEVAGDLLAVLGAHEARLRWEERAVLGSVRGDANRLANCDAACAARGAGATCRPACARRPSCASPTPTSASPSWRRRPTRRWGARLSTIACGGWSSWPGRRGRRGRGR